MFFNQGKFLFAGVSFNLFFSGNGILHIFKYFKVSQLTNIIFCRKTLAIRLCFVLMDTLDKITGHTRVKRAVSLIKYNVYKAMAHLETSLDCFALLAMTAGVDAFRRSHGMLEAGCGNVCIVCGDVVSRHSLPPATPSPLAGGEL